MAPQAEISCILSVNAGSSSLKLQLFHVTREEEQLVPKRIIKSSISGFTSPPATFTYKKLGVDSRSDIESQEIEGIKSASDAFNHFVEHLKRDSGFKAQDKDRISHICHRVVHGGELGAKGPVIVNDSVIKELEEVTTLAPLHNGPATSILEDSMRLFPDSKNIVFFDTSFHESLPGFIKTYPINREVAKQKKLRKYGFHGISYKWILKNVAKHLGKDQNEVSLIALHLGSGASICAIKKGKSYDTTMGLTPLDGLPGGSRSGTVDPSLIFHFSSRPSDVDKTPFSVELSHAENILNTESGFKALTGTPSFSTILATDPPTEDSALTINLFLDRILSYIGSYWLKLGGGKGGVDAIVFAGGIGEGSPQLREMIVNGLDGLNGDFDSLDKERNEANEVDNQTVFSIGAGTGRIKFLVCQTDEEVEMMEECLANKTLW
ncbi:hypothetical protein ABW19_dt0202989 [Dactylella cylindrospora]|nr:hypothetical protein ABW19_dt0202989 [Dactylella cylindrospora]